ncbi:carboxyl transferase domain protein [Mycobacterium ulcerans str. Harvey]|uniref:Carboxyl transferase domain protein n=1 Tax=Mycobacterium ulcerans str. Harvey TaxID=1299332 RepID=A0ABN0QZG8_MYCUL|nr:carboxyl transferase domain protein [Mycobacterium ulcerans str. Harvey]
MVSLVARDEAHAVSLAKRYLGYFQGKVEGWQAPDPRLARQVVPENWLRAYDVHRAIESIVDVGSVLELRADYGVGIVTALVRIEGVAYGLIANSSHHLGGAIDAEASDKATDFLMLCESFRLPVISLCDTPGFMVGPDAETQASVRRFGRMFLAGARLTVPLGMIILRKGYGLGAMAMAGGSFHAPEFTIAWPTGEIGGMGLEGAVRLGFSKELAAAADDIERQELFDRLVQAAYQHGKALRSATTFELDDVIDRQSPGPGSPDCRTLTVRAAGYPWPEPQPTPGMQPWPPGPLPGPPLTPPDPQLPLLSQPLPPGCSVARKVIAVVAAAGPAAATASAVTTGAAAIAVATAPATTSGLMRCDFANILIAYHARACPKHGSRD